jgi:hypothetical protein
MDARVKPAHDAAYIPRAPDAAQRAALRGVVRCRAGAVTNTALAAIPALRSGMKNAAPRPGHALTHR